MRCYAAVVLPLELLELLEADDPEPEEVPEEPEDESEEPDDAEAAGDDAPEDVFAAVEPPEELPRLSLR